jgi:predicted alpha/beta-fold hydrolase
MVLENGGHVGFIGGRIFKPFYWLDLMIVDRVRDIFLDKKVEIQRQG